MVLYFCGSYKLFYILQELWISVPLRINQVFRFLAIAFKILVFISVKIQAKEYSRIRTVVVLSN